MKITKLVHSCVLVEADNRVALFDPGIYSWQSGIIDLASWPQIDDVIITHDHPDHFGEDFVKAVLAHSPNAEFISTPTITEKLKELGANQLTTVSTKSTTAQNIAHAPVEPFSTQPEHIVVDWLNQVTHPGDTHEITATKDVLFLPITAPWGTTIRAIKLGLELKPKVIVPIHDWILNDTWRGIVHDRAEALFAESGIRFIKPVNGQPFEV